MFTKPHCLNLKLFSPIKSFRPKHLPTNTLYPEFAPKTIELPIASQAVPTPIAETATFESSNIPANIFKIVTINDITRKTTAPKNPL